MDGALVRCSSVWLKVLCTSDFALTIICTRLNLIFCDGVHRALGDLAPSSPKDLVVLLGSNGANNALAIMIAASIVKHKTSLASVYGHRLSGPRAWLSGWLPTALEVEGAQTEAPA